MDRSHLNEKMKIGMNDDSNRKYDMNLRTKTINNSVSFFFWKCRTRGTQILCPWDLKIMECIVIIGVKIMAHWITYSSREPLSV